MKRLKKIMLTFISLILTLFLAVSGVLIYAITQPNVYQHTFNSALVDKYDRLTSVNDPKIVLIGGSSMPFGVRSDLMERELPDYKVVNFGLYAALGSKLMLELSLSNLREGDIVVFAPEYSAQLWSDYFNAETTLQAFDTRKELAFQLPFGDYWMPLINAYPSYLKSKAELLESGIPDPQGVYNRSSFNEYGDISYDRPYNIMPDLYQTNDTVTIDSGIVDDNFTEYFNDYTKKLRKKGVNVYLSFAPVNALAVSDSSPEKRLEFYEFCRGAFDAQVISNIDDYVLDAGYFYDSNYHLNNNGAIYRTALLVGDLKRTFKDTSPIGISIPKAPEIESGDSSEGEDTDGADFVYSVADNGRIAIGGLSESGKAKTHISIPSYINGTAVYKLEDGALANAPNLESVDIPSAIRSLGNNLFEGSGKLRSVNLAISPRLSVELPSVGNGLLNGAPSSLTIYVPSTQYSRIITDYFWSRYASSIRSMD